MGVGRGYRARVQALLPTTAIPSDGNSDPLQGSFVSIRKHADNEHSYLHHAKQTTALPGSLKGCRDVRQRLADPATTSGSGSHRTQKIGKNYSGRTR